MQSQQLNQVPDTPREKGSFLSKAGQMTLQKQKYQQPKAYEAKPHYPKKILQEIDNDDEFMQLPNITTSYLDAPDDSPIRQIENQRPSRTFKKEQPKLLQVDESEYENVTRKIKYSSQMSLQSTSKKKYEKVRKSNHEVESELQGIEDIIGDIQRVLEASLANSKMQSPFKKETAISHHSAKRHFQSKGMSSFRDNQGINKLQQMLLSYQTDDPQLHTQQKPIQVNLKDPISQRRAKNEERMNRFKQYNEVSQLLSNTEPVVQNISKLKPPKKEQKGQDQLGLENIEIMEIDWFKLPLFLAYLSPEGSELLLKMKDCPDDESYWIAFNESLPEERQYSTYSIFNGQFEAGLRKEKTLMSEEQFREKWAEQWSYDIDEEQHKEMLCELDFQWYRSLVHVTYNHSLEDILMKDIKYDCQNFNKNLLIINGGASNDKNKASMPLPSLITQNKLKYVESLLDSLAKSKSSKSHTFALFIAVIPNMGQSQSKEIFEELKTSLQHIFVGALYSSDSFGASMGVIITKRQANDCKVKKWQGGKVQLGSVELLINQSEGGNGDRIQLSRAKSKNSSIRLRILRPGEQGIDLQVGEELYLGRRYHILLD